MVRGDVCGSDSERVADAVVRERLSAGATSLEGDESAVRPCGFVASSAEARVVWLLGTFGFESGVSLARLPLGARFGVVGADVGSDCGRSARAGVVWLPGLVAVGFDPVDVRGLRGCAEVVLAELGRLWGLSVRGSAGFPEGVVSGRDVVGDWADGAGRWVPLCWAGCADCAGVVEGSAGVVDLGESVGWAGAANDVGGGAVAVAADAAVVEEFVGS
ncbi:hypothetical protein OG935_14005 [Nocardia cyriacigeorgica]|uniref:hypothetical protein n=1 Tax=Nocardia cyriacigeorgica TaxID=135487 RepID=UPI0018952430|nr:hypothetical protein [Nocardia cyriacigeorgica]MBF6325051.1 hypothetical protein [Nocardia cyriacigeorgica]MBF6495908.1 hypothetical protein [Nocardia cyriacigeorgica]